MDRRRDEKKDQAPVRLQLFMARCGVASRRACEQLISQGRVTVNGRTVTTQGTTVGPEDEVKLDGKRLYLVKKMVYLALHKPPAYLCSNSDPEGRNLAIDLIRPAHTERLFNVGRLDFMSSGLIFFTNDGEFARMISHPSSGFEKEYIVESRKPVEREFLEEYRAGITIDGETYRLESFEQKSPYSVRLVLVEGKNREIRTVFQDRNIAVKRVHRVRIGSVSLSGLLPAHFRSLTDREIRWFEQRMNPSTGGTT